MGLDIYLYRYEDKEKTDALEAKYEAESERIWEAAKANRTYEQMSEAEKDAARDSTNEIAKALGLNEWGEDKTRKKEIELPSATYPDHLFKIGYFRSSYNEGGIHHKLEQCGAQSMDEIFNHTDDYCFQPDWAATKERAQKAIEKMREFATSVGGCAVTQVGGNIFSGIADVNEAKAMEIYRKEVTRENKSSFESYSNHDGHFFLKKALEVVAAIPGKGHFGEPCVYLIYKQDGGWDWYLHALEIVIETCDFVLSQPDQNKYWLHWSS